MATARDIIKGSLRLIGAIAAGETPSADELSDALSVVNDLMDSWSNDGLLLYTVERESFTLTPSTGSYTMGSGATFNTTRPIELIAASILSGTTEYPILDILTPDEYAALPLKSAESTIPTKIHLTGTYPNETIKLWPVPSAANSLVIYSKKPFTSFASANTTVTLPPGYARALRYNLAIELAPEYGKSVTPEVVAAAGDSLMKIMIKNSKPQFLKVDEALLAENRHFNLDLGE